MGFWGWVWWGRLGSQHLKRNRKRRFTHFFLIHPLGSTSYMYMSTLNLSFLSARGPPARFLQALARKCSTLPAELDPAGRARALHSPLGAVFFAIVAACLSEGASCARASACALRQCSVSPHGSQLVIDTWLTCMISMCARSHAT